MITKIALSATIAAVGLSLSVPAAAQSDAEKRLGRMDGNGDGMVVMDEYKAWRLTWASKRANVDELMSDKVVQRAFKRIDLNGDGKLELPEIEAELIAKG